MIHAAENADLCATLIPDLIVHVLYRYYRSVTFQHFLSRARIFKLLKGAGIDSKESIPPACVAGQARYDSPIPTRFRPHRLFKNSSTVCTEQKSERSLSSSYPFPACHCACREQLFRGEENKNKIAFLPVSRVSPLGSFLHCFTGKGKGACVGRISQLFYFNYLYTYVGYTMYIGTGIYCWFQCSGSGVLIFSIDSGSTRVGPGLQCSRSGSRRANVNHKNRKKVNNFMLWRAVCSLLVRTEDFTCSLDVLHEGLGINLLQFFLQWRVLRSPASRFGSGILSGSVPTRILNTVILNVEVPKIIIYEILFSGATVSRTGHTAPLPTVPTISDLQYMTSSKWMRWLVRERLILEWLFGVNELNERNWLNRLIWLIDRTD
jgi:hypothetical protein